MEQCPNCGGKLKSIAAILEQAVIQKILTHLALEPRAPPRAGVREFEDDWAWQVMTNQA